MKRYNVITKIEKEFRAYDCMNVVRGISIMEESIDGKWVTWEDFQDMKKTLEDRIPEMRIAKLEKAIGLAAEGRCVDCGMLTRDYQSPTGYFAPEAYATLRESGIDPTTGHKFGCNKANPRR